MKFNKVIPIISVLLVALMFAGCAKSEDSSKSESSDSSNNKITVTDDTGNQVTLTKNVKLIADGFPFHPELLTMLGAGDKVVGTITTPEGLPWLYKINPALNKAVKVFTAEDDVNLEELVKQKPDVVFVEGEGKDNKLRSSIMGVDIPVIQVSFSNFEDMKKSIKVTGSVLGSEGEKKAEEFVDYFDSKYQQITTETSKIQDSEKPKVLHITSLDPLIVDGKGTIMDEWIKTAGGINAAEIEGGNKEVSPEQVLKWNPDVIIIGKVHSNGFTTTVTAENLMKNPKWQQVNAVKNKKVYDNPMGAFLWDRFGPEEVLQIQWAAKTLHPDKFENLNISDEVKNFYKTFLNYNLTDDDVSKILDSEPPTQ